MLCGWDIKKGSASDLYACRGGIPAWISKGAFPPGGARYAERRYLLPGGSCVMVAKERSKIMSSTVYPCLICGRCADPENCTDKSCRDWQRWFLQQWERTRASFRQAKDLPNPPAGVQLGGRCYAAPHEVRNYLRKDPCGACLCPKDLCQTPCRKRLVWEDCIREDG